MRFAFDLSRSLILVRAELAGPIGSGILQLALDTGATNTVVNVGTLTAIGYDLTAVLNRVQVTTASGVEFAPRVELDRLSALGRERPGFPVLGYTLPASTGVDGALGLDFFRGLVLTIDFSRRTDSPRLIGLTGTHRLGLNSSPPVIRSPS